MASPMDGRHGPAASPSAPFACRGAPRRLRVLNAVFSERTKAIPPLTHNGSRGDLVRRDALPQQCRDCGHAGFCRPPPEIRKFRGRHHLWQQTSSPGAASYPQTHAIRGLQRVRSSPVSRRNCCRCEKWEVGPIAAVSVYAAISPSARPSIQERKLADVHLATRKAMPAASA